MTLSKIARYSSLILLQIFRNVYLTVFFRNFCQLFDVVRQLHVSDFNIGKDLLKIILNAVSITIRFADFSHNDGTCWRNLKSVSTTGSSHDEHNKGNKEDRKGSVNPYQWRARVQIGDCCV